MTCDSHHMTAPDVGASGAVRAMRAALADAGLEPEAVDYINAHGTATPPNDLMETRAIKEVFGSRARKIPVSSTKSMHGHTLGASGALEAVVSLLAITEGFIPPTIHYETPDPECDLDYVTTGARPDSAGGRPLQLLCLRREQHDGDLRPLPGRGGAAWIDGSSSPGSGWSRRWGWGRRPSGRPCGGERRASGRLRPFRPRVSPRIWGRRSARFQPRDFISVKNLRKMDRLSAMTTASVRMALDDAGITIGEANRDRIGIVMGTAFGNTELKVQSARILFTEGPGMVNPIHVPNTVMNAPAGHASIELGFRGVNTTVNHQAVSAETAIAYGAMEIRRGAADVILAGGADILSPFFYEALTRFRALSPTDGGAEGARPFDRTRNGPVMGEGCGIVCLEAGDLARERGAAPYAEVTGWGLSFVPGAADGLARRSPRISPGPGAGPADGGRRRRRRSISSRRRQTAAATPTPWRRRRTNRIFGGGSPSL